MKLEMNKKTSEVIKSLGGNLTIDMVPTGTTPEGGFKMRLWSGAGKPEETFLSHYDVYEDECVTLYILKGIHAKKSLHIRAWPKIPLKRQKFFIRGIKLP